MPSLDTSTEPIISRAELSKGQKDENQEENVDADEYVPPVRYRLSAALIDLSESGEWVDARTEWELSKVYRTAADNPGKCLCGHSILEHCVIVNRLNGNEVTVGNHCVKQFLDLPSEAIFAGLRRIAANPAVALTLPVVEHLNRLEYLTEWEYDFLQDMARLRKKGWRLFPRQREKLIEVNAHLLERVTASGRGGVDA
jgi:hypothetical protein